MAYTESLLDKLSTALSPVIRKLSDVSVQLVGTKTNILRITETKDDINDDGYDDLLGDTTDSYSGQVIQNVIIAYPFNEVEALASRDSGASQSVDALYIDELLPITMYVPFEGTEGTQEADAIDIDVNDIIVDVLYDANDNKIPIIMHGPKIISGFFGKHEVSRKYELTLVRGDLEDEIQTQVDAYVDSL